MEMQRQIWTAKNGSASEWPPKQSQSNKFVKKFPWGACPQIPPNLAAYLI